MYQPIIYYHFSTCPFIYPSIYQFTHHPSIIYLSVYLPIIYLSLISHLFLEPTQLGPYPSLPCTLYFHFMYHRPLCFSEHTSTLKKNKTGTWYALIWMHHEFFNQFTAAGPWAAFKYVATSYSAMETLLHGPWHAVEASRVNPCSGVVGSEGMWILNDNAYCQTVF